MVKIDVEGYELEVLKGKVQYISDSKSLPSLIVEFSSNRVNTFGENTSPLYSFLDELKIYKFFKAIREKERVSKLIEITNEQSIPKHDNVFCFTDGHLSELPRGIFKTMPNIRV